MAFTRFFCFGTRRCGRAGIVPALLWSVLSGVTLALAIPNELLTFGSPLIGMFALVPFYVALSCVRTTSDYTVYGGWGKAFWCGWVQAFTAHMLSSFWLGNFRGFAVFTLGASAVGTGFVCAFSSLVFYFPFAYDAAQLRLKEHAGSALFLLPVRVVWFSALYTAWEWAKSYGFLAYPWGTLSMTAYPLPPIMQVAAITGPYGVTFLFALVSAVVGEGIVLVPKLSHAVAKRPLFDAWLCCVKLCAVTMTIALLYGTYQYLLPRYPIKTLNAVLVQQNLDPWDDTDDEAIRISTRLSEAHIQEFADAGAQCDVVVWSEAVLSRNFPGARGYYTYFPEETPLIPFIKQMGVPFIIGAPLTINRERHQYGNATVLFDKEGEYKGAYVKMHLVPFAERIPFVEYAVIRSFIKKIAGFSYGWTQGTTCVLFEIPVSTPPHYDARPVRIVSLAGREEEPLPQSVFVSTPICFDDAFSEVCRALYLAGSEVFINLTNDAWSRTNSAELQHFVVASYRAIEYRTTLARSTNAGFTTVLDPAGRILQSLPLFEEGALSAPIPVYERKMTLYARFGDWFPLSDAFFAAVYAIAFILWKKHNA